MGAALSGLQCPDRTGSPYQGVARGDAAEPEADRAQPVGVPQKTLHVSVAWLLAMHASYPVSKDHVWKRHGEEWTAELNRIAAQSMGFPITYEHVVATDSAVVALARPTEPVNRIREMIRGRLRLPPRPATRRTWCTPRYFAIAARFLTRRNSSLCSRTRAPKPLPRSTSW